jgi:hypothetical protein
MLSVAGALHKVLNEKAGILPRVFQQYGVEPEKQENAAWIKKAKESKYYKAQRCRLLSTQKWRSRDAYRDQAIQ